MLRKLLEEISRSILGTIRVNFKETFWVGLIKHRKSTEKKMLFEEED